ncbi:MAG: hypothetical protein ACJ8FV_00085 [Xanthobacteraceae bacterium]
MALTAEESTFRELAASRHELVRSVVHQIEFSVEQLKLSPDEARKRFRGFLHDDPDAIEADQVSWLDLSTLAEDNAERAQALWQRLKDEASDELTAGIRTAGALERPLASRPVERAAFAAIVAGLRNALAPRDALEDLLIQQMAAAYELHLRWQAILVRRMEEEVWQADRDKRRLLDNMSLRERERYQENHGWLPPRLTETEALDQAAILADRAQRAFLRLMKAFRDNRRLFGALVVAGGQVNIGEQQVNIARPAAPRSKPGAVRRNRQRRRTSNHAANGDELSTGG